MSEEPVSIIIKKINLLVLLGLKSRYREVFTIDDNVLIYNSVLGQIGEITSDWIEFIDSYDLTGFKVVRIGIKENYKTKFKYRMSRFNQKMSELYLKNHGAEIIIFPKEMGMPASDFLNLLRFKLKK